MLQERAAAAESKKSLNPNGGEKTEVRVGRRSIFMLSTSNPCCNGMSQVFIDGDPRHVIPLINWARWQNLTRPPVSWPVQNRSTDP